MNNKARYLILALLSFFLCYYPSVRVVFFLRYLSDKYLITPFLPNFLFSLLIILLASTLTTLLAKIMKLEKLGQIFAVSFVVYLLLTTLA